MLRLGATRLIFGMSVVMEVCGASSIIEDGTGAPSYKEALSRGTGHQGVELGERQFNTDPRFHSVGVVNWGGANSPGRMRLEDCKFVMRLILLCYV